MLGRSFLLRQARQTGTLGYWATRKGFGWITPQGGERGNECNPFVHHSELKMPARFKSPKWGAAVEYDLADDDRMQGKKKAVNVTGPGGADVEAFLGRTWIRENESSSQLPVSDSAAEPSPQSPTLSVSGEATAAPAESVEAAAE